MDSTHNDTKIFIVSAILFFNKVFLIGIVLQVFVLFILVKIRTLGKIKEKSKV